MKKILVFILVSFMFLASCVKSQAQNISPGQSGVSYVYLNGGTGNFSNFTAASTTVLKKVDPNILGWFMQFSFGSYIGSNVTVTIKPVASIDGVNYFIIPRQLPWVDQFIKTGTTGRSGTYQYSYIAPFDSSFTISQSQTPTTVYRYGSSFPYNYIGFVLTKTAGAGSKCPFNCTFGYTKETNNTYLASNTINIDTLNISKIHGSDSVIFTRIPSNVKKWSMEILTGQPIGTHTFYITPIIMNIKYGTSHNYSPIPRFKYNYTPSIDSTNVVTELADTTVTVGSSNIPSIKIYQGDFLPTSYIGIHVRKTANAALVCPVKVIFNYNK